MSSQSFHIAVTGHRLDRLATARLAQLGPELHTLFALLQGVADGDASPLLISALAEGADRAAAHAALAAGWQLGVVLPCAAARYEQEFSSDASRAEFRQLLARAAQIATLAVGDDTPLETAYAALGHDLVSRAQLLLAVWDGAASRGPGGTAEVVREALARGIPVLHVWSLPGTAARLLSHAHDAMREQPVNAATLADALAEAGSP